MPRGLMEKVQLKLLLLLMSMLFVIVVVFVVFFATVGAIVEMTNIEPRQFVSGSVQANYGTVS